MNDLYQDEVLYQNIKILTKNTLPLIAQAIKDTFYPIDIDGYPNLTYNKKGFPSISKYPSIPDVAQFLGYSRYEKTPVINLSHSNEFTTAYDHLYNLPNIRYYFIANQKDPAKSEKFVGYLCEDLIESIISRYYYLHGQDFNETNFKNIYLPIETYIYAKEIWFDIAVPILFIKFESDHIEISDKIIIRKISDEANRSRHKLTTYSPAVVDSVYMSATHELVLKDYYLKKPENWFNNPFTNPNIYPDTILEKFFSILEISTGYESGYAQWIVYPHDWADSYSADILPLKGTTIRKYPTFFDDYYWNHETFPEIDNEQAKLVSSLFNKILLSKENKLEIALKRYYKSLMRQEEEDIILDLIIALEILLGDNEKSEITHKLALRLSVLICRYNNANEQDPLTIFKNVKKIYAYRSSIVHGSHKVSQKREIKLESDKTIPIVELAKDYLSELLKIVILQPKHLNADENDKMLLIGPELNKNDYKN